MLVTANLILSARVEIFVVTNLLKARLRIEISENEVKHINPYLTKKSWYLFLSNYWLRVFKMEGIKRVG